jgi:hypothetical protein
MSSVGPVPATAFSTVKPPAVVAVQPVAAPAPQPANPPAELVSRPAQSLVQLSPAVLESAQPANPRGAVAVVAEVVGPSQRQAEYVDVGGVIAGTGFVAGLTGPTGSR